MKLDLGCGQNKKAEFLGVDALPLPGVDLVADLRARWPWEDGSVEEVHCSHFIEHLTATERVFFVNELYRVLKPGGKATMVAPHWSSCRAYGDPTHQWPPVSEFWFYYLLKAWRDQNAPHCDVKHSPDGFACDFEATWGYVMNPSIVARNQEYQSFALSNYKEAAQDIVATLVRRPS